MKRLAAYSALMIALVAPSLLTAQSANPTMDAVKAQWNIIKGYLTRTAAKVPDDVYAFRATPEVRTFGQIMGHIIDAQHAICASAEGEKPAQVNAEKSMTTKAQLSKALADSIAYCDKVMASMDDKKAMETVKFFAGGDMTPRALVLSFNTTHSFEHYGNLVTYMRLNKIVPPSSEPASR